ncbi:MAG TPA: DUF4861 family protein [bacterium]|nr:DUF4861 family protein [bacterium]
MRFHTVLILILALCGLPAAYGDKVTLDVLVYWQGDDTEWEGTAELAQGDFLKWEGYHWENRFDSEEPHRDGLLDTNSKKISWKSHTAKEDDGIWLVAQLDADENVTVTLNGKSIQVSPNALASANSQIQDVSGDALVLLLNLKRLKERIDVDGDGDPDELILDETARRAGGRGGEFSNPKQAAECPLFPIAVRVIDDDDDMTADSITGDEDSDCFIADYDANGAIDRMLDWIDNDGDGDADEMDLRYYRDGELVWGWFWEDVDDDNRMWSVANYEYREAFASDMYGNNIFWLQKYDPLTDTWLPYSECPFSFHDLNGDGWSEGVVRVSAVPEPENNANSYDEIWGPNPVKPVHVSNVRYSFDIDNDSNEKNELDYDFGFTLVGALPYQGFDHFNPKRRPPQTMQRISHSEILELADNYPADLTGFSWDEFDRNHRWEGIFWSEEDWVKITLANAGGPPWRWNKRREFDCHPSNQRQVYYSPVDQRIHCFGAEWGWIEHGYMWSEQKFAETKFFDSDGDGFFDRWEVNLDNRGSPERVAENVQQVQMLPWDYAAIQGFYLDLLPKVIATNQSVIASVRQKGLSAADTIVPAAVEEMETHLGEIASQERLRYVTDLLKEYYVHAVLIRLDEMVAATSVPERRTEWSTLRDALDNAFNRGYMDGVIALLEQVQELPKPKQSEPKKIAVRVSNPLDRARDSVPVVIRLADLPEDFKTSPFRVVDSEGKILPGQMDDPDGDTIKDEIFFQVSLGPKETRVLSIRYGDMDAQQAYSPRARAQVGQKFYVSWESDLCAFRSYFGKMDVFGKNKPCLFMQEMESPWVNTHAMQKNGMDILSVGPTSGLGGLNIWHEGKPYQVDSYGESGNRDIRSEPHFRILANGPVRTLVDIAMPHWKLGDRQFEAATHVVAWAGRRECRLSTKVRSLDGNPFEFGPGLTIVGEQAHSDPENRILWCWGEQKDMGAGEIGLAILYPSEALVQEEDGSGQKLLRYQSQGEAALDLVVVGGWTHDGRFKNGEDWYAFLKDLRREIDTPVQVEIVK